ncbi:hypothetical protein B296_00032643 [Ensete ventricosum]|uniref:ATP-citrate synthase ATP-grasp domain-containing protein n=1 Tax=Ensete ventricosum TaxID=4639 RepID=A0A426YMX6_ENSVE|nr:hypothetical protein B296_00032643 [Ensete ventricosum]
MRSAHLPTKRIWAVQSSPLIVSEPYLKRCGALLRGVVIVSVGATGGRTEEGRQWPGRRSESTTPSASSRSTSSVSPASISRSDPPRCSHPSPIDYRASVYRSLTIVRFRGCLLVVKPDMLFGKRGKSGLVALNLDLAQAAQFIKERLGVEVIYDVFFLCNENRVMESNILCFCSKVEMGGCKAPITTFIIEPFVPHDQEYYLSIVSERLGSTVSFSECGGIEIEENWDKVKTVYLPTEKPMTGEACAPLIATLPLEVRGKIGDFIKGVFTVFQVALIWSLASFTDLDFSFIEMNPFTLVNGEPYPLDMRGELDDTAAFKNFKK